MFLLLELEVRVSAKNKLMKHESVFLPKKMATDADEQYCHLNSNDCLLNICWRNLGVFHVAFHFSVFIC